jgi:transcriptional regulator with XRE-family HTH domain
MELVDRIKVIMKVNQLTASQLADEIGVQRSNVSHVLSERNKPSFEFIHKLLLRYPKVNAHWLITGKSQTGESEIAEGQSTERSSETTSHKTEIADDSTSRNAQRIVVFFADGTFETYRPRNPEMRKAEE